jgi:hypothetical protein
MICCCCYCLSVDEIQLGSRAPSPPWAPPCRNWSNRLFQEHFRASLPLKSARSAQQVVGHRTNLIVPQQRRQRQRGQRKGYRFRTSLSPHKNELGRDLLLENKECSDPEAHNARCRVRSHEAIAFSWTTRKGIALLIICHLIGQNPNLNHGKRNCFLIARSSFKLEFF